MKELIGPLCYEMSKPETGEREPLVCEHDSCWSILYESYRDWVLDWLNGGRLKWKTKERTTYEKRLN